MQVQVAPEVGHRYQVGQFSGAGSVQLVGAAPQFRRYPGQAQASVEGFLVGEPFRYAGFDHGDAVLVEGKPLPVGVVSQAYVVLLASGKILQHRAYGVGFADA